MPTKELEILPLVEISQKEFHDSATALIKEQLALVNEQKEYGKTIKRATIWTAIATVVMAIIMIISYIFPIRESVSVSQSPVFQSSPPAKDHK